MTPSQIKGMLYGLAVGDALGVPYEFKARGTFACGGMAGHGTHGQPAYDSGKPFFQRDA